MADPRVYPNDDGYFMIRFKSKDECNEIIQEGPYFMGKALIVIKK